MRGRFIIACATFWAHVEGDLFNLRSSSAAAHQRQSAGFTNRLSPKWVYSPKDFVLDSVNDAGFAAKSSASLDDGMDVAAAPAVGGDQVNRNGYAAGSDVFGSSAALQHSDRLEPADARTQAAVSAMLNAGDGSGALGHDILSCLSKSGACWSQFQQNSRNTGMSGKLVCSIRFCRLCILTHLNGRSWLWSRGTRHLHGDHRNQ
jgi:hypothetical protein